MGLTTGIGVRTIYACQIGIVIIEIVIQIIVAEIVPQCCHTLLAGAHWQRMASSQRCCVEIVIVIVIEITDDSGTAAHIRRISQSRV